MNVGFDLRADNVRSVVDTVAIGGVFLRVLEFSPVSIMLWLLHTDHTPLTINAIRS